MYISARITRGVLAPLHVGQPLDSEDAKVLSVYFEAKSIHRSPKKSSPTTPMLSLVFRLLINPFALHFFHVMCCCAAVNLTHHTAHVRNVRNVRTT